LLRVFLANTRSRSRVSANHRMGFNASIIRNFYSGPRQLKPPTTAKRLRRKSFHSYQLSGAHMATLTESRHTRGVAKTTDFADLGFAELVGPRSMHVLRLLGLLQPDPPSTQ